jgi:predicted AlkP superfamily pyrophosphatase or phosphodiesterase
MPGKLLLIILDGCRPDALQQADTPNIDSLWQNGAYTWKGQSVMPSVTLPAHTTMFRGISPAKHGVGADNVYVPSASVYPSFVEAAKLAQLRTAMFYSWEQLRDLSSPGSLDMSYCANAVYGEDNDTPIAQAAAAYLTEQQPDLFILYLGDIDITGHLHGWMSPEYMSAIETNDRAVGLVLNALARAGIRDAYTILLQADHGGHDTDHGTDSPEDMTIPWILNGVGVRKGHALQTPVRMIDTAPTIAHILGIPQADAWEGAPILEAFV